MAKAAKMRQVPLVPTAHNQVLLPGVTVRIPLTNRGDVAAILANVYSKATTPKPEPNSVVIGCVPLNSAYLSPDGKRLIEDADGKNSNTVETDPAQARKPDLFQYGTLARVTGVQGRRPGELALVVEGISRFKVHKIVSERPYFEAQVVPHQDVPVQENDTQVTELLAQLKQLSKEFIALIRLSALLPRAQNLTLSPILSRQLELYIVRKNIQDAGVLADWMINIVDCTHEDRLRILCALSVPERLERIIEILQRQISTLQGNGRITVTTNISRNSSIDPDTLNRLRQDPRTRRISMPQGNGIGLPGGFGAGGAGGDEESNEVDELKKKLDDAKLSPEAQKVADRELKRLAKMNPAQAEHQVCRNYLENLAEIPWTKVTEDNLNAATLERARKQLDDDHYGLEKIKKRLLEYLAVLKLKHSVNLELDKQIKAMVEASQPQVEAKTEDADSDDEDLAVTTKTEDPAREQSPEEVKALEHKKMVDKSPILLLVGPPGTGKTSLAKSVATSLGRQFHRISLGGVRDEAEIRGHRRTYVAAMPGLIVNGLKKVGVANPVFLLDEIDKVGTSSNHGDPSAAMLEVLDPEQNHTFVDHYVNIPIDLSKVLFIATANTLDTIPPPLLDRMETISLSGYTSLEKRHIANQHLIPKQIMTNALTSTDVNIPTDVLDKIITGYTRESGVRNLEREIGSVCRSKAVQFAEAKDTDALSTYQPRVALSDLEDILGVERFEEELAASTSQPGVVTGLVAYSSGTQGSILFIEILDMPGTGRVQLTGKLGDVLKESVEVALSWVKNHAYSLALVHDPTEDLMKTRSIHVHCPSGAVPKDGPSAGLAHTIALISLFSGRVVPPTIAMTGEVALRGKVLPVGGIKEKLIGALRAGVKKVLIPQQNRKDVKDLPMEVKQGLEIVLVGHIWEALPQVWPGESWGGVVESLL